MRLKRGDQAPALELNTEDGTSYSLHDFKGNPVIISFLSHAA